VIEKNIKSDSVETKGKSSLFHCDECDRSFEEEKITEES
jgi:hypothetical protein